MVAKKLTNKKKTLKKTPTSDASKLDNYYFGNIKLAINFWENTIPGHYQAS